MLSFCAVVMIVCGLITLFIPKDKFVKPTVSEEEKNRIIKNSKTVAVILIILGLFYLFVY